MNERAPLAARGGRWLGHSRQAGRPDLDPGRLQLKRLFNAKKAGHAGTLDPLASGVLPIAFGEATKTVPFVQDGEKAYRFTVRWGEETDTDDTEGQVTQPATLRPAPAEIEARCCRVSPARSCRRRRPSPRSRSTASAPMTSPATARRSSSPRAHRDDPRLRLVDGDRDQAVFEAECGKGAYVRAIARDLGRLLGCHGHVVALRRTRVGPFFETESAPLADLLDAPEQAGEDLLAVEAGLSELPCIVLDRNGAARLRRGQSVILRGRDAPAEGPAYAVCAGTPIASGVVEAGEFLPNRVFNLPF